MMNTSEELQQKWTEVDHYITSLFVPSDPVLDAAIKVSVAAGLPPHNVSPNQGKLLSILAQSIGARTILEIGTLGGYSTIWLARALPSDGRLFTLEINPKYAEIARTNFARAGLTKIIDLRLGSAFDTLPQLKAEARGPFDLIFIDADKRNNPDYFTWALKLSHRGSLIIVDNVIRNGAVTEAASNDPNIQGVRRLNELLAAEPRVSVTEIQTVGNKGYDGFALALVTAE